MFDYAQKLTKCLGLSTENLVDFLSTASDGVADCLEEHFDVVFLAAFWKCLLGLQKGDDFSDYRSSLDDDIKDIFIQAAKKKAISVERLIVDLLNSLRSGSWFYPSLVDIYGPKNPRGKIRSIIIQYIHHFASPAMDD